jgi:transcription elongation factor Elf1
LLQHRRFSKNNCWIRKEEGKKEKQFNCPSCLEGMFLSATGPDKEKGKTLIPQ